VEEHKIASSGPTISVARSNLRTCPDLSMICRLVDFIGFSLIATLFRMAYFISSQRQTPVLLPFSPTRSILNISKNLLDLSFFFLQSPCAR
jgi:hypothetical protein